MPTKRLFSLRLFLLALTLASVVFTAWLSYQNTGSIWESNHIQSLSSFEALSPSTSLSRTRKHQKPVVATNATVTSQALTSGHGARVLLGISSFLYLPVEERQRRHLIRNTYLDFDRLHRANFPNRVCSLKEYLRKSTDANFESDLSFCQLVYAFILAPPNGTTFSDHFYGSELEAQLFDNHEADVVYLNVDENDHVAKRWAWLNYSLSLSQKGTWENAIDYVAYTDAHLMIKPSQFWSENGILSRNSMEAFPTRTYAGSLTTMDDCTKKKCPSLLGDYVMRRFFMLSLDLVEFVCSKPIPILKSTDVPDVAIANAVHAYPYGDVKVVALNGLVPKVSKNDRIGDFLQIFDRYKDSLVEYDDPEEVAMVVRSNASRSLGSSDVLPCMLLGIVTMESDLEKERRNAIRRTYLQAFSKSDTPHRICSLLQLDTMEASSYLECQLAYVFVIGGNPNGPTELVDTELVDVTAETGPLTIDPPQQSEENDIVYLNIKENGKEGKSQTFFKYATTILEKHYFDYIGKTDTDTLLYPKSFFESSLDQMPKFPDNMRIYAGDYRIKPSKETLNLGPAYMGGHFYFMSPDLARYITSSDCNRSALSVYSEDQSMGNFVHSLSKPIRRIRVRTFHYEHPVKRVDRMQTLWRKRQHKDKQ